MNILRRYITTTLSKNKQRTALSLLSLILATALLFFVSSLLVASYRSVNESIKQSSGNYHVEFESASNEFVSYLNHNIQVETLLKVQHLGFAQLKDSFNEERVFTRVLGYSEKAFADMGIVLLEGRLPRNPNECVISEAILNEAKVAMEINEKRSFVLGHREMNEIIKEDEPYSQAENFIEKESHEYKIVGIISEPMMDIGKPYYSILTLFDETKEAKTDVYLRYHDLSQVKKNTLQLASIFEQEYDHYTYNEQLLALNFFSPTVFMDSHLLWFVGGGIVLFLFVTMLLIRNSFASSYINREKHLAILKSVGVTKRQRQAMVFFEGFIILSLALPLGLLLGILLLRISIHTINQLLVNIAANAIQLTLQNEWGIALASILFVLTAAILSIQRAAHKAMNKSVSSTLHSNDEVREHQAYLRLEKKGNIYAKLVRKHLIQNLKDYDIAFISVSLILTLSLLLSASLAYLKESGYLDVNEHNYDVQVKVENPTYPTGLMTQLKQMETSSAFLISEVLQVTCEDHENMNRDYLEQYGNEGQIQLQIISYDDKILSNYLRSNHLVENAALSDFTNPDQPMGVLISPVYSTAMERYYDVIDGTKLSGLQSNGVQLEDISIVKSDVLLSGVSNREVPQLLVSATVMNHLIEEMQGNRTFLVHYQTNNSYQLARDLNLLIQGESVLDYDVVNANATFLQGKTIATLIELLLYGYILCVGLMMGMATLCMVATNFEYRKHEFILYRLVGMRMKNVRSLLAVEYFIYFTGVFICSWILFQALNYGIYYTYFAPVGMKLFYPVNMIHAILLVGIVFGMILILVASYKVKHFSYDYGLKNEISLL